MRTMRPSVFLVGIATAWLASSTATAQADLFGSGPNAFAIDFVTIGDPGNSADTTGAPNPAGSVAYAYRIGKYEISEQMIDKANALGGLGITKDSRGPDKPATGVDWFEAARFVNWLNVSEGHTPAYKFGNGSDFQIWTAVDPGYDAANLFRNSQAKYFLPSVDEWYKAAYYDPVAGTYWDYPTGSNAQPTPVASGTPPGTAVVAQGRPPGHADITEAGGLSPSGTMAQGGNIVEWQETSFDLLNESPSAARTVRGGSYSSGFSALLSSTRYADYDFLDLSGTGFRVASSIPEPSGLAITLGWAFALPWRRMQRNRVAPDLDPGRRSRRKH